MINLYTVMYRKVLKILIIGFGLFFIANKATSQKIIPEYYDGDSIIRTGIQYYDEGKYEKALAEFDKIFKTDPQYYLSKYESILTLSAMELPDQMHDALEEWYQSGTIQEVPEAAILYGNSLVSKKKFDEANVVFEKCKKTMPESPILMYNIALMHYNKDEKAKCIDYLKKTILLNPNHVTAHYLLGVVCLEEGKIAHGALALLGYLALDPTGQYAEDAVQQLNVKMSQNYINNESKVMFPAGVDDFAELESLLRDQLPLNPKYKLKVSIDEIFTRHLQAIFEYSAIHDIKDGFFEKNYVSWLKDIASKNMIEPATYYLIQNFKEKLGKPLASKEKEINQFTENWVNTSLWQLMAKRKQLHYGKEQEVVIFLENGHPSLIGQVVNGKYEGEFRMVDKHYKPKGDLFFKNDKLNGKQIYYQDNGKILEETPFVDGKKTGVRTAYFENGAKSVMETYKDNAYDGPFTTYYPNGAINCEGSYTNDILNGSYNCRHMDGSKRLESTFVNDKLNGSHKMYNPSGDLISSFEYINGDLTGAGWEYLDGKALVSSGNYKNGKADGPVKVFWANQTLKNQSNYENGKIKSYEEYFVNGKPSEIRTYNTKEELESISYFDINGDKNYEEKYASGEFKSGYQYQKGNPKPVEIKKSDFAVKYADGTLSHKGKFVNDMMSGKWLYHHYNGNPSFEFNYIKGITEGVRKTFDKSGKLTNETIMKQNKANGLNKIYENGYISQVSYYINDQHTGPYKVFRRDSTVKYEGYLINNENHYDFFNYYNDNRPISVSRYIDNVVYQTKYFDKNGQVSRLDSFLHLNGEFSRTSSQGLMTYIENYKNGVKSGKYITKESGNVIINELNYLNDQLHGKCTFYNQSETLANESTYYNGKPHGLSKYYDMNGVLRTTSQFIYGEEFGTTTRYYQNGKPVYTYESAADMKHGEYVFYNIEGNPVASLGYNQDYVEYYKVIDKSTGALGSPMPLAKNASMTIESKYPDGKEAFTLQVDKSIWNNILKIIDKSGNQNYYCEYKDGKINGIRKEFYPGGKPYKIERFSFGDYHGDQEFYDGEGRLLYSAQYKNDEIHGELKIYKNGKLIKTKVYDSDELTSIKNH